MSAELKIDAQPTAEDACLATVAAMPSPSTEEALEDGSTGFQPMEDEPAVSSAAEPASPLDDGSPSSAVANDASPDDVSPEPEMKRGGQSVSQSAGRLFTKTFVKCGTPGCELPDFHDGPCSCHIVAGPRGSRSHARPSSAAGGTAARPMSSIGVRASESVAAVTSTAANGDDESSESGEEDADDEAEETTGQVLPSALACGDASFMLPKQPVLVRLRGPFAREKQPRPDGRLPTPTLLLGHSMPTIKRLLEVVHTWVMQHRNGHIDWAAVGAKMRPELSADEAHRLWRGVAYNTPAAEASESRKPPAHLVSTTREELLAAKMDDGDSDHEHFEDYRAASTHNEQVLRARGEACAGTPTPDRLPLWPQKGTPRIPGRAWPLACGVAWPALPADGSGPLGLEGVRPPGRELAAQRNDEVWRDAPLRLPPPKPWKPDEDVKLVATVQRLGTKPPVRGEYEHIFKRSWHNVGKRLQELVKRGMISAKALNPAAAQPLLTASAKAAATLPPWAAPTGPAPPKERLYKDGSAMAPRQKQTTREVPQSLIEDEESSAVWTRAREIKDAGVSADVRIHGWRIVYELREDAATAKGDIYCLPPEAAEAPPARAPAPAAAQAQAPAPAEAPPDADVGEVEEAGVGRRPKRGAAEAALAEFKEIKAKEKKQRRDGTGISKQTAIRSFVALQEVLEQRLQLRTTGKLWVPPAVGALVEVEVVDPHLGGDAGNEWRRGEVRKVFPDGRFQVCIYTRGGLPDEDFIEWYARQDEGKEWRRVEGQPDASTEPPPQPARKQGGRGRGGRGSRSRGSGGRGQPGCAKCRYSAGGCGMCAWKVHLALPTAAAAAAADDPAEMDAAAETGSESTAAGTAMTD